MQKVKAAYDKCYAIAQEASGKSEKKKFAAVKKKLKLYLQKKNMLKTRFSRKYFTKLIKKQFVM